MQKKLSIVIPVYNGEKDLRRSIDSVLSQQDISLEDLDLILINDGSTDSSKELLEHYQREHPTIVRFIDQKNAGAAKTRNKGIDLAVAPYVLFVDQDDFIDPDYCATLYNTAFAGGYDVVLSGFKLVDKNGVVKGKRLPSKKPFGRFMAVPAWAKIHRTDLLRDSHIHFFENNIGEDNVFSVKEIIASNNFKIIDYAGYNNAFDNSENVTNTLHKGLSEKVNIVTLLDELAKTRSVDPVQDDMIVYNIVRTAVYYLLSYGRQASRKRFNDVYAEVFEWLEKSLPEYRTNKYVGLRCPSGETMTAHIGVSGLVVLHKLHLVSYFAKVYCRRNT